MVLGSCIYKRMVPRYAFTPIYSLTRGIRGRRPPPRDAGDAKLCGPSPEVEQMLEEMQDDPKDASVSRMNVRKLGVYLDYQERNSNAKPVEHSERSLSLDTKIDFRKRQFEIEKLDPKRSQNKRIKELLDNSSGYLDIQSSAVDDPWATSPYPVTTDIEAPPKEKFNRNEVILLFPGQGAQFVGMGKELLKYPNVKEMYESASAILGYDLLKLCLEGPPERLEQTIYCQPATLVTTLAAVERLRDEFPRVLESCYRAIGYSVGEYAALTFAGAFSFEEAVKLVQTRAELMQKASQITPSGMSTVFLRPQSNLKLVLQEAAQYCLSKDIPPSAAVCEVAIHLLPACKVIGGHNEALRFVEYNAKKFNLGSVKKLAVSGAFHTSLMKAICEDFKTSIESVQTNVPTLRVMSNVDTLPYRTVAEVKSKLVKQLTCPVRWEQILHKVYDRDPDYPSPLTYECGPGRTLGTTLRYVNSKAFQTYRFVGV